ncbi:MAG: hypothetical protein K6E61_09365 [Bacteroidales bacterium]|nr:hypothetical protein [Bacteroidales bacterium]
MRKNYFVFAALAAVMMVSCAKEIAIETPEGPAEQGKVTMTFLASAEETTKAVLDSDGKTVNWSGAEEIAVFDNLSASANIFTANGAGASTSFTGTVTDGSTSFVAVYPASAAVAFDDDPGNTKPISAIIPNVQEATLNSFDPAAALFVAESTDLEAKFTFKAAFALLRVNVNIDDVKAITVENTKNNFAGSIFVSTSAGVSNGDGTTYKKITLKKSDNSVLAQGTYYIVVRHLGETSNYENFKLTYIKEGAYVGERTSATVLDNTMLGRKSVLNLGGLSSGYTESQSWYAYYQAGYDVKVGSKTINVATDGDATLWTADNAVYAMTKSPIEAGGIFFLKAVGTGTFNQPNNPTVNALVCFISDTDDNVDMAFGNVFNIADDAILCFKGVNATMTGGKSSYLSVNKNTSKSASDVVIDRCKFELSGSTKYIIATNSSYTTFGINNIEMINCRFAVGVSEANLVNVTKTFTGIAEYKSMTYSNNYSYSTTGANVKYSIFAYSPDSANTYGTDMAVVINNNLFYNTVAAGTFKHNTLASASATKNVYSTIDASGLASNAKMFGMKTKAAIPSVSVTDNVGYGPLADGKKWTIADSTISDGMDPIVTAPSDPVESANTTTGVFTMAAGYESYGPQGI